MSKEDMFPSRAGEVFRHTVNVLKSAGFEEADSDARLLFEKAAGIGRKELLLHSEDRVPDEKIKTLEQYIEDRLTGKPVQYITGEAWFYGRKFEVRPGVLIPRFDTEILAEEALKAATPGMRVLDLCTGSGCIIITLSLEAGITGYGSDISDTALQTAKENCRRLQADCRFLKSDLLEKIDGKFDMIVSNPPYIRSDVIRTLQCEVREHEPLTALDGGADGLDFYRRIAEGAPNNLEKNGCLMLEIGYDQAEDVLSILKNNGYRNCSVIKDLSGNDRVIKANV